MYIPDNYDCYKKYEAERERDEHIDYKITDAVETIEGVVDTLDCYEQSDEVAWAIEELRELLKRL